MVYPMVWRIKPINNETALVLCELSVNCGFDVAGELNQKVLQQNISLRVCNCIF